MSKEKVDRETYPGEMCARATDSSLAHTMQRDAPYMQMTAVGAGWPVVVVLGVVVVAACAVSGGPLAGGLAIVS